MASSSGAMAKQEKLVASGGAPAPPERNKKVASVSAINFIIYILCIASFGAAVYSNVRLRTYDERIKSLESFIYDGGLRLQLSKSAGPIISSAFVGGDGDANHNYGDNVKVQKAASQESWMTPSEDLLQRLQHQVAGIQRLRRDVSQLQVNRSQRQVPDCVCPAGECDSELNSRRVGGNRIKCPSQVVRVTTESQ